jgi:hypothetical protein
VPVAAIFVREITPALTSLVKKLDEATEKGKAFWVVVLTDDDKAEARLKELAEKEKLKKVTLAIESPAGPPSYKIAKDADVTVLLYQKKTVQKNYAFEKGKLTEKDSEEIVSRFKELSGAKDKPK